jgi:hypothetical protein
MMWWLSFIGKICGLFIYLWSVWLLLLAYRIVGKPAGQDPKYDASIAYWSGTYKVLGALGILVLVLEVISFVVGRL